MDTIIRTYKKCNGSLFSKEYWKATYPLSLKLTGNFWKSLVYLKMDEEFEILKKQGYIPQFQTEGGGQLKIGITILKASLTAGLSLLFPEGRHSKEITITYFKKPIVSSFSASS